jgi:tRNA threonylcarbamoyladenosine biosynthesis protein TsaB
LKLLALDTSTECCSVALLSGDVLTLRETLTERGHAELVLPFVDALLTDAGLAPGDLDGLAFGRGPGAFTGLRIAAGVVQGLAYAAGLRVVPVSSLAAVAARVPAAPGDIVIVCNDARMGELYWGHYVLGDDGAVVTLGAERVGPPDSVIALSEARHAAGNGLARHAGLRAALAGRGLRVHEGLYPRADAVARLGAAGFAAGLSVAPEDALPVYVRDEVATARAGTVTPLQ